MKKRRYTTTHPWLNFSFDLAEVGFEQWILLGEIASKFDHVAKVPLQPSTWEKVHRLYLAKGAHATSAIEGNSLTVEEVGRRIRGELELPVSQQYLGQEIDNVVSLFDEILDKRLFNQFDISPNIVTYFNRQVLSQLPIENGLPGEIRSFDISVNRYLGAPPEDCQYLLERLCEFLNGDVFRNANGQYRAVFGVIRAILGHVFFELIHPFPDGNGRTGRMLEFLILLHAGAPSAAAHILSNHYNRTRSDYYRCLDAASKKGTLVPFVQYAIQGFVDGLREQLDHIWQQQNAIAWEHFVHDTLRGDEKVTRRLRHLVLDMGKLNRPVSLASLDSVSSRVARDYAGLLPITLRRDVKKLIERKLIIETEHGLEPNRALLHYYLPVVPDV